MIGTKKANRLIHSTSPYLLQHAYNPVDWHEWGDEALSKAKQQNKPILISIGYSSCHWCHVMEREVFEKEEMATIMNQYLICIKVDREERPDIDSIYMEAVQALGINGGWPLNVFLTPDQKPFYGGTYFPPDQWENVIHGIHKGFTERRAEVDTAANELTNLIAQQNTAHYKKKHESSELKTDLEKMFSKLSANFDKTWGGLDKAPKFVMPSVWLWLLRYQYITKNEDALNHLNLTLKKIAWGGIYDQIGGGFSRYSVDGYWFAPHFEKMLYDNAQLVSLYSEAYALTKEELYKNVVTETCQWLEAEMMHPNGGFFSALDADSEGVEGKFYSWQKNEIEEILKEDAELFCDFYNVKTEGNWEHGKNILFRTQPDTSFLQRHKLESVEWKKKLRTLNDKLLEIRDQRVRPGLDDKVITSWNAMMVVGLTDAYKYLGDEKFLSAALRTMKFLEKELMEGTSLFRSYKNKRSITAGFLDDYAYVIQAYIRLYQVTFDENYLHRAEIFLQHTMDNFYDPEDGFFFYTSGKSEILIARRKELFDNVIPASNSVMVQNLFHLGTMLENEKWKQLANTIVSSISHLITQEPNYMSNWGIAYTEIRKGLAEVVITGKNSKTLILDLFGDYEPFALSLGTEKESELPLLKGKTAVDGKPTFYVCYNKTCQKPVHTITEAREQVRQLI